MINLFIGFIFGTTISFLLLKNLTFKVLGDFIVENADNTWEEEINGQLYEIEFRKKK